MFCKKNHENSKQNSVNPEDAKSHPRFFNLKQKLKIQHGDSAHQAKPK